MNSFRSTPPTRPLSFRVLAIRIIVGARRPPPKGQPLVQGSGGSIGLPDPQDQTRSAHGAGTLRNGQDQLRPNPAAAVFRQHHKPEEYESLEDGILE